MSAPAAAVSAVPIALSVDLKRQLSGRNLTPYLVHATGLEPQTSYRIDLSAGSSTTQSLTTYSLPDTLPDEGLTIAIATCFYEGFNMGAKLQAALSSVRLEQLPYFQLWGGDNLYGDVPVFSGSNVPFGFTVERYLRYFEGTAYGYARSLTPNFTTYDDHEYWNNYPESQMWLSRSYGDDRKAYIDAANECRHVFQDILNPPAVADGTAFTFDLDPVSFFVADLRSDRSLYDANPRQMMTEGDLASLEQWAVGLQGPGVLVLGQPLWIDAGGKNDYNPPAFSAQYQRIWAAIRDAPWDILVVSGDVHHSRVLEIDLLETPGRKVFELVTSPASHIPTIASTIGFGNSQDRGSLSPPGSINEAGLKLVARYYFGTTAQNTYALARFSPRPGGEVEVGIAFVDYGGSSPTFPVSERCNGIADSGYGYTNCHAPKLFTLRRR